MQNYKLHKDKIGKGHAWPMKRTMLDAALDKHGVFDIASVSYIRSHPHAILFRGDDEQDRVVMRTKYSSTHDVFHPGMFHLYIYSVPYDQRIQIRHLALGNILPRVMQWIREIRNSTATWRDLDHNKEFACEISPDVHLTRLKMLNSVTYT